MLRKFERTNQGTNYNQTPLVELGQRVEAGQVLADGPGTHNGEMSLGRTRATMAGTGHGGHDDLTSSPPSSGLAPAVPHECPTECWQHAAGVALVAGLNPPSPDTS